MHVFHSEVQDRGTATFKGNGRDTKEEIEIHEASEGWVLELALLPIYNWLKKITWSSPKVKIKEMYNINGDRRKFLFSKAHNIVHGYREEWRIGASNPNQELTGRPSIYFADHFVICGTALRANVSLKHTHASYSGICNICVISLFQVTFMMINQELKLKCEVPRVFLFKVFCCSRLIYNPGTSLVVQW